MTRLFGVLCALMVVLFLAGLVRVYRGPTHADRMLAATLMTSTAAGAMLLLGRALEVPEARHVALIIVLLAALSVIAFARIEPGGGEDRS